MLNQWIPHSHARVMGASFIIAGTAIGAGMLALPLVMYPMGLGFGILLLILAYIAAAYSALILLEVNLRLGKTSHFFTSIGQVLGRGPQIISHLMFLVMLYALISAYLASGSQMLALHWSYLADEIPAQPWLVCLFVALFGGFSLVGVHITERVTRLLFLLKLALFLWLVSLLTPYVHLDRQIFLPLASWQDGSWLDMMRALPVAVTSFGFHVCIPTLVHYLDANRKDLIRVMMIGSSIPFVFYLIWLFITVGVVHIEVAHRPDLDLVAWMNTMDQRVNSPWMPSVLRSFADTALITSFIGVSMSLYDFWANLLANKITNKRLEKLIISGITFIPALVWVLLLTNNFTLILSFAVVPLVILTVFLPIAMLYKLDQEEKKLKFLKFNTFSRFGLLFFGLVACIIQFYFTK